MCRWLGYTGQPIFMEEMVTTPCNSLIVQSRCASEAKTEINADGLGLGWYNNLPTPGIYREVLPAWSDDNLKNLCQQIKSGLFFAHVRASTGTSTNRTNCHPFSYDKWMFMHNGQIGDFHKVRRKIENMIPDHLYEHRRGTTDSEAIFLCMVSNGLETDPINATVKTLNDILQIMKDADIGPLRFTSLLSDGETVYAFRLASDQFAPSLYSRRTETGITIASEPCDSNRNSWNSVPSNTVVIIKNEEMTSKSVHLDDIKLNNSAVHV